MLSCRLFFKKNNSSLAAWAPMPSWPLTTSLAPSKLSCLLQGATASSALLATPLSNTSWKTRGPALCLVVRSPHSYPVLKKIHIYSFLQLARPCIVGFGERFQHAFVVNRRLSGNHFDIVQASSANHCTYKLRGDVCKLPMPSFAGSSCSGYFFVVVFLESL